MHTTQAQYIHQEIFCRHDIHEMCDISVWCKGAPNNLFEYTEVKKCDNILTKRSQLQQNQMYTTKPLGQRVRITPHLIHVVPKNNNESIVKTFKDCDWKFEDCAG